MTDHPFHMSPDPRTRVPTASPPFAPPALAASTGSLVTELVDKARRPTAPSGAGGGGLRLPTPPDDDELYWYLGRQHRWLIALQAVSFALVAISATRLALSRSGRCVCGARSTRRRWSSSACRAAPARGGSRTSVCDSVPGDQYSDGAWADATGQTVAPLLGAGRRVAFLLDTPQPAFDTPECLAEHLSDVGACNSVDHLSDYPGRRDQVQSVLETVGASVVDPIDWFCVGRSQCPAIVGNLLVYRDLTHMTRAYSDHLSPLVEPLLTAT